MILVSYTFFWSVLSTHYLDEYTGWITADGVSRWGDMYYTTNGGMTWDSAGHHFATQDIQFIDKDTGWVVGWSHRVFRTTNGGIDWIEKSQGLWGVLTSGSFINGMEGWVAGAHNYHDNFDEEVIFHTTDGGETWEFQDVPNRSGPLNKIHVLQSGIGFAYGWGEGIRTTNRGETWEIDGPGNQVTALYALDEQHVYLSRNDGSGTTIKLSTDTGKTWGNMLVQAPQFTKGIYMLDAYFGCAVGAAGKVWMFDSTTVGVDPPAQQVPSVYVASLYPNPVWESRAGSKTLNFEINGVNETDGIVVSVSNVLGETWIIPYSATGMDTGVHLTVSTGTLLPGYYFYRISFNKMQRTLTGQFHIIQ